MANLIQRLTSFFRGNPAEMEVLRTQVKSLTERMQKQFEENRGMRAKIDAAQTTEDNRKHWANADALGPNAAYDATVRQRLRIRGRYETTNNCYLKGLVRSQSYDLIGTGPRPQVTLPNGDTNSARLIEKRYAKWQRRNKLPRKFRTMHKAACRCGAGLLLFDSWMQSADPVKFTLRPVEIDLLQTPPEFLSDPLVIDGIRVDGSGNPEAYYFLKQHPGERNALFGFKPNDFETIPAERVIHWYLEDRPGQQHGIPEITPALPLMSKLRRFSDATLTAAEFAAMIAGVLKTDLPADATNTSTVGDWQFYEMVRGALMALPANYEASQMKAEHPNTTFPDFERVKLTEAGRSVNAPQNVITGNSSGYSFSGGRLDHLPYHAGHWIDRDDFQTIAFDPIFAQWAAEGLLVDGYFPAGLPDFEEWTILCNWDGFPEIDQTKSADADDKRLRNGTATLGGILAERDGANWREALDQLAEEVEAFRARGLKHPFDAQQAAATPTAGKPPQTSPDDDEEEDDEEEENLDARRNGHAGRNGFHLGGRR